MGVGREKRLMERLKEEEKMKENVKRRTLIQPGNAASRAEDDGGREMWVLM